MRPDTRLDDTVPAFTLVCPGYRGARSHTGAAAAEGNLTFTIGSDVVAEIDYADLIESWQAACELSWFETEKMTELAANHLTEMLDVGVSTSDITDLVTDAAVVLLLAMKRHGITDPKRIPACTVMWNGQDGEERVFFGA